MQPLDLFITPPPHDKLHVDQAVQSDKPPSTDKQYKMHDMKLYSNFTIDIWRGVLDTTLCDKVVSDFQQVGGILQVLWFPPPIK